MPAVPVVASTSISRQTLTTGVSEYDNCVALEHKRFDPVFSRGAELPTDLGSLPLCDSRTAVSDFFTLIANSRDQQECKYIYFKILHVHGPRLAYPALAVHRREFEQPSDGGQPCGRLRWVKLEHLWDN